MASNNLINEDELYLVEGDEYTNATQSKSGLMSNIDKSKLDGIATGANKTIVDTTLSDSSTNPVQNKVIKTELDKKADNTALDAKADKTALDGKLDKTGGTLTGNLTGKYITGTWLQTKASTDLGRTPGKVAVLDGSGWVYYRTPAEIKSDIGADAVVTTSSDGLMSVADKKKLDGIDTGANKITVDTSLSSTSTNPVQNKVVNSAISNLNTLVGDTSVSTQITNAVANKVDKVSGKGLSANDYTTTEKNKLAGISENAEVNQNAFSNVVVGSTTISADSKTDTLTLVAGNNVTLTPDSTNDKITIAAKDTTYSAATTSSNGLMSASDKSKLDGIATGATKTIIDTSLSGTSTNPVQNKIIKLALDGKAGTAVATTNTNGLMSATDKKKLDDIATGANKIIVDTTLSDSSTNPVENKVIHSALSGKASTAVATQSVNGLMSSADKKKLDGIAIGATKITVDTALSSTSTNPVQNKVINSALSGKAGTSVATTSANGLMSSADKTKLNGIATGATKTTVDTALSDTSTNPVQNKVIKIELDKKADNTALDNKFDKAGGTLTGNLTGKYITGTWLQTTEATDFGRTPGKIAVLDESGWVYYRTPAEIKSDIGVDTQTIIDTIYPMGSIYITLNQTSPSKLFPGTYWKQIKNRFLLSASSTYSASSVGGEATHTLTKNEMPNHQHSIWFPNGGGEQSAEIGYPEVGSRNTYYAEASKTSGTGGGAAHNNMPPYLVVYMWERVYKDQVSGYNEDAYFLYGVK